MAKTSRIGDTQYAALPYRFAASGRIEVLLITSRETQRWVVPKGWPMKGRKPHEVAKAEAIEEGGVRGRVARRPIGSYHYSKEMPDGDERLLAVDVYPMLVSHENEVWSEAHQRARRWFSLDQAASDGGLALIIEELERVRIPSSDEG